MAVLATDERDFQINTQPPGKAGLELDDAALIDGLHLIVVIADCSHERFFGADVNLVLVNVLVDDSDVEPAGS